MSIPHTFLADTSANPSDGEKSFSVLLIEPETSWRSAAIRELSAERDIRVIDGMGRTLSPYCIARADVVIGETLQLPLPGSANTICRPRLIEFCSNATELVATRYLCGHIKGIVLKDPEFGLNLVHAIRSTIAGHGYLGGTVSAFVQKIRMSPDAIHKKLSSRKIGILLRFAAGWTLSAIAEEVGCTETTAKWHLHEIMAIVGAHSQAELLRRCAR